MNPSVRLLVLLLCFASSTIVFAQTEEVDPVSLVIKTTNYIFTEVDENFESYEADPTTLQTLVRTDLMPLLDVHYSARLILGACGSRNRKGKSG